MSFLEKLGERDAEGVKHKPVNSTGMTANGTRRTGLRIGERFQASYVQEPMYEGDTEQVVEDEERRITDRKHSEKTLKQVFKKHVTFKDYLKALYWRITK